MPLTSFGEVIGTLERELNRVRDLHDAAVALNNLDAVSAEKRREFQTLDKNIETAKGELTRLGERVEAARARAADAEKKADQQVAAATAAANAQIAAVQLEVDNKAKAVRQVVERDLAQAKATLDAARRDADIMLRDSKASKAALKAEIDALVALRDRIKMEVAALKQRLMDAE